DLKADTESSVNDRRRHQRPNHCAVLGSVNCEVATCNGEGRVAVIAQPLGWWSRAAQGSEAAPQFLREQVGHLERCKMPATIELVPVEQTRVDDRRPTACCR